jgi:hypothetical protein
MARTDQWMDVDLFLDLLLGPAGKYTDDQLERAWQIYGEEFAADLGRGEPGQRPWGWWRFVVGVEEPATCIERVLLLAERGLLTDEERRRIASDAAHARKRVRCHWVISPPEAAERMERNLREREDEAIAIAEALSGS